MRNCLWILYSFIISLLLPNNHVAVSSSYNATDITHLSTQAQKLALFQFKLSLAINPSASQDCDKYQDNFTYSHPKTMSWSMSSDYCKWEGVSCNPMTGDVIGLDLNCSQLVGNIPPNSTLFQLSHLRYINFKFIDLRGVLPEEIFHLSKLIELSIYSNYNLSVRLPKIKWGSSSSLQRLLLYYVTVIGGVPDSIGYLKSLTYLALQSCNISGTITNSITNLTQLTGLDLVGNHLSGQIPDSLANLRNLKYLFLGYNNLNGQFPSWVSNHTQLQFLHLSDNLLTGPLTSNFNALSLSKLNRLYLENNLLNGTIPSWLFNIPSLEYLHIDSNEFTGQLYEFDSSVPSLRYFYCKNNFLNGTIPKSFSELVNLTVLDVSSNNFNGVIDVQIFSHLQYLHTLQLSHNSLSVRVASTDTLSPSLGRLGLSSCKITHFPLFIRSLKNLADLDLSNNQIHGDIPQWIGLTGRSLIYLNLSHNSLTGGLEQLTWNNLQYLDLQFNMFNGSLPTSICNMSALDVLNLSHNNLSGVLPSCPSSLNYSLSVCDLRMNSIGGSLPSSLSNFHHLRSLNLHGNKLEGTIPMSFSEFDYLEVLDLGSNRINGTFPYWLEDLQNLQVFVLKSNKFHGIINIDSKIEHSFPSLRIIDLSDNEFSGPLPTKYVKNFKSMMNREVNKVQPKYMGDSSYKDSISVVMKGVEYELVKILTVLTTIDLSRNNFEGEIPPCVGNLVSLIHLNLSHNHLTGIIPFLIGKLTMLESLDLSSNQLVGEIPQGLTSLYFLSCLDLSRNDLSGHIPEGYQFDTYENLSYAGNTGLCGRPLSNMCGGDNIELQEEEDVDDDYFFNGFPWKAVVIGYGCGVVVGFVGGCIMFMAGKPKWYVGIIARELGLKVKRIEIVRR